MADEGHNRPLTNGDTPGGYDDVVYAIPSVPITEEQQPFISKPPYDTLKHAGTPRANIAPSTESPNGTTKGGYAKKHEHRTVLQQHCDFFDRDHDGIIWPQDTFAGFYRLGYMAPLCLLAVFIIHANFSYPTLPSWLPDPFFRIHLNKIHRDKHGSDTNTYDHQGRFSPQHFENIFTEYADGRDYLTFWDVVRMLAGQRCVADPIGWGGAFFEWVATYILLSPHDGRMMKEDIRGIYDGSLFYTIAARRAKNE